MSYNNDERNFRSHYYEKVGFKGVEEKRSLEILLKEDPLDLDKLSTFCQRFPVPSLYRPFVWKVILGILPLHQTIHTFVTKQRYEQYHNSHQALIIMRQVTPAMDIQKIHLQMYQLEEGELPLEDSLEYSVPHYDSFESICTCMSDIIEEEVDVYWLSVRFHKLFEKYQEVIPKLNEKFEFFLKKEDSSLYTYLSENNLLNKLPYKSWFQQGFCNVLPVPGLERIWDKMIGGSSAILIFTALSLLVTFKRSILNKKSPDEVLKFFEMIPPDNTDMVVNKALELWNKYGSPLKPDI
ncbi:TBC1 domain family member 7-like [Saccoglossus kowalevskii]|uniref:TBC1 domain family member 7 n=1 Tax=Saccoglossus kowalevskii TaxID=10224 RepID=A0ABM0M249_SACKO|nr:PREDICTED: TBC1 domain family member 7-like [Saccoglossus kowalevskii]